MGKTHWVREKCTLLLSCVLSVCCCWPLRPTSCSCHPLVPPVLAPLAQPWVRGWGEPFPCPSLGLALPGPDPKFANVQPVSDTPKHPEEKNMLLLCFLPALHQQMLSRLMGWQLKKLLQITLKLNMPLSVQYFLHILLTFICVYNCTITFVFWDVHEGNGFQRPI